MSENGCSWPEQDAIETWTEKHRIALTFDMARELAEAVTKPRLDAAKAVEKVFNAPSFQAQVDPWLIACFGEAIARDKTERNHRFLEEALELIQSLGCTEHEVHQLVAYVYARPWGDPAQEVGGVMTTLAATCLANELDMHVCADDELARIWTKVEVIRAKQDAKPKYSPLPCSVAGAVVKDYAANGLKDSITRYGESK